MKKKIVYFFLESDSEMQTSIPRDPPGFELIKSSNMIEASNELKRRRMATTTKQNYVK